MQEVSATKTSDRFDLLRSSAYSDAASSQSRAFADFLGLMSQTGGASAMNTSTQDQRWSDAATRLDNPYATDTTLSAAAAVSTQSATAQAASIAQTTAQAATQTTTQASGTQTAMTARQFTTDASQSTAKNAPVSREAFEEATPILAKAGLSDTEIADLRARSQSGTLTWGQLVQSVSGHMTGAKKPVSLSTSETQDLQLMFQKLGFGVDQSQQLVASVASGDGGKVMAKIQEKLASMPEGSTPGIDQNQLATFFKALRVPQAAADKLTQALGTESTVADLKSGLNFMGQALREQSAKTGAADVDVAKALGAVMQKDVAKSTRDASHSSSSGQTASSGGSTGQVAFELKTKDRNDTSWFSDHEKNQQKNTPEDSWRDFNAKVRVDDATARNAAQNSQTGQSSLSGQAGQTQASQVGKSAADALDALANRTGLPQASQQAKADAAQTTAKAFDKVATPKLLDQVQEAMLKDLGQGRKQLTVQLDPEDLGKLNVMLQVKGKEVSATLKAEDPQTATMLQANLDSIKKTLEDQGLKVQSLEVQTGLAQSQDQQAQFAADQHNQAQERQELSRVMSQLRMLRSDSADMAPDMQNVNAQAILADRGLHLIA